MWRAPCVLLVMWSVGHSQSLMAGLIIKTKKEYNYFNLAFLNERYHNATHRFVMRCSGKDMHQNLDQFALINERYHCFALFIKNTGGIPQNPRCKVNICYAQYWWEKIAYPYSVSHDWERTEWNSLVSSHMTVELGVSQQTTWSSQLVMPTRPILKEWRQAN